MISSCYFNFLTFYLTFDIVTDTKKTKEEEDAEIEEWEDQRRKREEERKRRDEEAWEREQQELQKLQVKKSVLNTLSEIISDSKGHRFDKTQLLMQAQHY